MRLKLFLVGIALLAALFGCGGGSSSNTTRSGKFQVTIKWPNRPGRLVPVGANSARVAVTLPAPFPELDVIVNRVPGQPLSTATVTVQEGNFPTTATAHPGLNGVGVAQAMGSSMLNIVAGRTTNLTITMDSTITSASITTNGTSVQIGGTMQFGSAFKDAAGNTVIVHPSVIQWTSDNTAVATVDANGLVSGVSVGPANITVKDTESGKSATVAVTVTNVVGPAKPLILSDQQKYPPVPAIGSIDWSCWLAGGRYATYGALTLRIYAADKSGTVLKTYSGLTQNFGIPDVTPGGKIVIPDPSNGGSIVVVDTNDLNATPTTLSGLGFVQTACIVRGSAKIALLASNVGIFEADVSGIQPKLNRPSFGPLATSIASDGSRIWIVGATGSIEELDWNGNHVRTLGNPGNVFAMCLANTVNTLTTTAGGVLINWDLDQNNEIPNSRVPPPSGVTAWRAIGRNLNDTTKERKLGATNDSNLRSLEL